MAKVSEPVLLKIGSDVVVKVRANTPVQDLLQQLEKACRDGRIVDHEGYDITQHYAQDLPGGEYQVITSAARPSNASQLAVGRQQSLAAQRPCEMASPATQVTTGKQQAQAACQAEPLTANTIHLHSNQAQCVSALAGPMQQLMEAMQPSQRAEPAPAASAQTHHLTTGNQQKATQVVGSKLTRQQAQSETMQTAGSLVRKATAEEGRSESPAPAAGRDSPAEPAEKRQKLEGPSLPGGSGYKMQNKPHLVWQTGLEAGVRGAQDAQQVLQRKYTCWRDTIRPYLHPDGNVNLQLACWAKPNTNKRYNEEKDLFMEVVRRGAGSAEREQQVLAVMAGMKMSYADLASAFYSLSKGHHKYSRGMKDTEVFKVLYAKHMQALQS